MIENGAQIAHIPSFYAGDVKLCVRQQQWADVLQKVDGLLVKMAEIRLDFVLHLRMNKLDLDEFKRLDIVGHWSQRNGLEWTLIINIWVPVLLL